MQKKEPILIADGYTNEEIFQWMLAKAQAGAQLESALAEKKSLQQELLKLEGRIFELTNSAALEFLDKGQAPTHLQ